MITFESPVRLLVLLVVPALLVLAVLVARRRGRYPVAFTNLAVLAEVAPERRRSWKRLVPLALLLLALVFAAGAIAHPRAKLSEPDQNATIVLLVDVSGSMRADDVMPSRLGAAVDAMTTFLNQLPPQFKVGLVAFSSTPQPMVAPTLDRNAIRQSIELLQPEAGTAVGDGVAVASAGSGGRVPVNAVALQLSTSDSPVGQLSVTVRSNPAWTGRIRSTKTSGAPSGETSVAIVLRTDAGAGMQPTNGWNDPAR